MIEYSALSVMLILFFHKVPNGRARYHKSLSCSGNSASIAGLVTPNELHHRAKWPKQINHKGFDKLGVYSRSSKMADALIEA